MKKHLLILLALALMAILLPGCTTTADVQPNDLMAKIEPNQQTEMQLATILSSISPQARIYDFSARLFQQSCQQTPDKNTLVSPLSVMLALAMTANGAENNTLAQMETTFGLSLNTLNGYLQFYAANLPQTDKAKLSIANSIWFKEDSEFVAKQNFLQANADYYNAGVYQLPFNSAALKQINAWVKQHTNGMIDKILDKIDEDAVAYLINALAFEAEWLEPYNEYQVREGDFTNADGQTQKVDFMYNSEHIYLEDENTQGFIKYYADGNYAFAALLPNEGISLADYLTGLDGAKLDKLLNNPVSVQVNTAIPKFENDYTLEMNDILQNMGIVDAFDKDLANFRAMADFPADYNLFIDKVLHKTYIKVDEKGTKAGAVTAVAMAGNTAAMPPQEIKTVYLDRPFVYLLIDTQQKLPLFIGAVQSIEQ